MPSSFTDYSNLGPYLAGQCRMKFEFVDLCFLCYKNKILAIIKQKINFVKDVKYDLLFDFLILSLIFLKRELV